MGNDFPPTMLLPIYFPCLNQMSVESLHSSTGLNPKPGLFPMRVVYFGLSGGIVVMYPIKCTKKNEAKNT